MSGARAWLISVCTEFHATASSRVDGRGRPIAVGCGGVTVHPLQARDAAAELASGAGWCDKACTDGEPGLFGADGPEAPKSSELRFLLGAPGRIRTCDARFRKPTLYPLSYEGGVWPKPTLQPRRNRRAVP